MGGLSVQDNNKDLCAVIGRHYRPMFRADPHRTEISVVSQPPDRAECRGLQSSQPTVSQSVSQPDKIIKSRALVDDEVE